MFVIWFISKSEDEMAVIGVEANDEWSMSMFNTKVVALLADNNPPIATNLALPGRRGQKDVDLREVEEAICFGWIDSLIRRLDDERYVRKFTPRKADSKWSTINRKRYADMQARGFLAEPGLARPPTDRSGDAKKVPATAVPAYIEVRLKTNPQAWHNFQELAPSYRRNYIGWIDSAKRPQTREKRLQEALELLAAGKKLGLK